MRDPWPALDIQNTRLAGWLAGFVVQLAQESPRILRGYVDSTLLAWPRIIALPLVVQKAPWTRWRTRCTLDRARVLSDPRGFPCSKATAIYQVHQPYRSVRRGQTRQHQIIKEDLQLVSPHPGESIVIVRSVRRTLPLIGKAEAASKSLRNHISA
jgi:hypothetical protein